MRTLEVALVLGYAGACVGRRMKLSEQETRRDFNVQSRNPFAAMAALMLVSDPETAYNDRSKRGSSSRISTGELRGGAVRGTSPRITSGSEKIVGGDAHTAELPEGLDASPASIPIQGGSLRTWTYLDSSVEQVQINLGSQGRPIDADIELWHGPDNTPVKMRVYVENGKSRPFSAVIDTPEGPNTVAIRNIGQVEFPLTANVASDDVDKPSRELASSSQTIQGGALRAYPVDSSVESVQVLLKTDNRPLLARIELMQGPNNNKQVIELYTDDGLDRPFFCFLETPGEGNVIRIINTAPVEYPLTSSVVPHSINHDKAAHGDVHQVVMGGDVRW